MSSSSDVPARLQPGFRLGNGWVNRFRTSAFQSPSTPAPTAPPRVGSGYRADIDGLRSLAILPVLFHHVGVRGFHGGFVGVDVFFVISGYLISGILLRELSEQRFSIATFYRRRILRIFPALFVLLVAVSLVATVTMLPGELVSYAHSLAGTALFSSNVLFYLTTGYFEPAAQVKPLLHTWSLGIEEQFYIFWPVILAVLFKYARGHLLAATIAIAGASLLFSLWLVAVDPTGDFYLLPTRAWELLAGALLAIAPRMDLHRLVGQAAGLIGVGLILFAIKFFNDAMPFPGAAALLPCLGTVLIIASGAQTTLVSRLLSLPPLVFIGRISFSLYLWHWPVVVFTQIGLLANTSATVQCVQIAASCGLAYLSWRFVEQPFRHVPSTIGNGAIIRWAALATIGVLGIAGLTIAAKGWPARFSPEERRIASTMDFDGDAAFRGGQCFVVRQGDRFDASTCLKPGVGKPAVLLLGDSHGAHLWPGLSGLTGQLTVLQATHTGCRPMLTKATATDSCASFFDTMLGNWLPSHQVGATLLAGRWTEADLPSLEATLKDPRVRAGHPILVGPIPQYGTALPRLLIFAERRGQPDLVASSFDTGLVDLDRRLASLAQRTRTPYFSFLTNLCNGAVCRQWASDGTPLQYDYGHLTASGSRDVAALLLPVLIQTIQPGPTLTAAGKADARR